MAAESSGFFNAVVEEGVYDRVYTADQFAAYFAQFIGNGVFGGIMSELKVYQSDDTTPTMNVKLTAGKGYINGYWYSNEEDIYLPVETASTTSTRTDMVVLRCDYDERTITAQVIKDANTPVRNDSYFDLMLATITIPRNATAITNDMITDTRLDNAVCGLVTGLIDQVDTTDLYNQFEAYFTTWKIEKEAEYENWYRVFSQGVEREVRTWIANEEQLIMNWFETIKGQISEDLGVRLQLEIDDIMAIFATLYDKTQSYSVGDYTQYNFKFYKCISDTTGDFDSTKWEVVNIYKVCEDAITLIHAKENIEQWTTITLAVNGWTTDPLDNTRYIYSLESSYPVATYDITNVIPSTSTTADQRKAWAAADCGGYDERNVIVCHGTVPTVAIPLSICVRKKVTNPNYSPSYNFD